MKYDQLERIIIHRLQNDLPANMYYHHTEHTIDVINAAMQIAKSENIPADDQILLKTAALMHDTGFLFGYKAHEVNSCAFAKEILSEYDYDEKSIDQICELILATRVPQQPQSELAKVLCDADLDYLGRDDFYSIAETLFQEFSAFGIVNSREGWNLLQQSFFESHHYHTVTSLHKRTAAKEEHLVQIRSWNNSGNEN